MIVRDPHVVPPKWAVVPFFVAYCAVGLILLGFGADIIVSRWIQPKIIGYGTIAAITAVGVLWGAIIIRRWRSTSSLLVLPRHLPWSAETWEAITVACVIIGFACLGVGALFASIGSLVGASLLLWLVIWYGDGTQP